MERLIIIENGEEIVFNIESRVVTIGRSSKNDITIKDRNASRRHCNIIRVGEAWFAVDCDSQNGTQVNQSSIKKHELEDGDKITVGAAEMIFMVAQDSSQNIEPPIKRSHPLADVELHESLEVEDSDKLPEKIITEEDPTSEEDILQEEVELEKEVEVEKEVEKEDVLEAGIEKEKEISENITQKQEKQEPQNKISDEESLQSSQNTAVEKQGRRRRGVDSSKQAQEFFASFKKHFGKEVVGSNHVAECIFIALVNNESCLLTGPSGSGKLFSIRMISQLLGLSFQRTSNFAIENNLKRRNDYNIELLFPNHINFIDHNFYISENMQTLLFDFLQNQKIPTERKTSSFQQVNMLVSSNLPEKYSLQMAQFKDSFMLEIPLSSLELDLEKSILENNMQPINRAKKSANFTRHFAYFQMLLSSVKVSSDISNYVANLVFHSNPKNTMCSEVKKYVSHGASRKGGFSILKATQTYTILQGRNEVTMEDINAIVKYALRHRITINENAQNDNITKQDVLNSLIKFLQKS